MPYLIIPGMSGSVELKGLTEDINVNAGDIFSHLQFGFMAQTQVSYNRMFLGTDTVYMGLGGANDQVNVGIDQWEAELLGGYYVQKHIAFLSGVRYNSLTGGFKFKGPDQANMRDGDVWWDPFVGGKVKLPLTKKLDCTARLDIGGFGVGSKIAVNAEPYIHYQINERFKATAGWRFLYEDYVNDAQVFKYDVLTQGLVMGFTIGW